MKKGLVVVLIGMCCALLTGCLMFDTDVENFRDPSISEIYNYPSPNSNNGDQTIKD